MRMQPLKYLLLISTVVGLWSCSHKIKPVDISQNAVPTEEVDRLASDLQKARQAHIDLMAPENFEKAQDKLVDAQKRRADNDDGGKILKSVALGRAYLNEANGAAKTTENQMLDVIKARELAMAGGAGLYASDLSNLDRQFRKTSERLERGKSVDRQELANLQAKYYDLELVAIKGTKLSEAQNILRNAEKKGAKRSTPQSYKEAEGKIASAEKIIEVDRHDAAAVDGAVAVAVDRANRALVLVDIALENRNRSSEEVAREIEARMVALNREQAQKAAVQAQATSKDRQLALERQQLAAVTNENRQLEEKEQFNKMFEQARSEFAAGEADVYRQGDNMIIRLKSIQFSSGRAELPGNSMPVLSKVKDVIAQLGSDRVVVEGHTDSAGNSQSNMELSAKRASAVANYIIAENALPADKVVAVGLGDAKPITSNKSKAGRAQNRRVDIVIKPISSAKSSPPTAVE